MAENASVLLFDTQRAVEDLVAAGMPQEQAGVVVRQQAQWVDRSFATGEDVERLRTDVGRLHGDVESLRGDLQSLLGDMKSLRGDLESKIESQGVEIGKDMARLREDLNRLRGDLESKIESQGERTAKDMAALRSTLEARILASETNTIKWVTGTQVGTSAIFLAALLAALKL